MGIPDADTTGMPWNEVDTDGTDGAGYCPGYPWWSKPRALCCVGEVDTAEGGAEGAPDLLEDSERASMTAC